MKYRKITLIFIFLTCLGLLSFQATHALFTSAAHSNNNTFTASAVFPSAIPTVSLTPTPTITITPTPTIPSASSSAVVINELMWTGSSVGTSDEWVELRNMTSNSIDLSNWKLIGAGVSGGIITIPSGKSIDSNGFFLISNSASASSILNIIPDVVTASVSLSNTSLQVTLKDSSDSTVDIAGNGAAPLAGSNTPPKKSMERKDPPVDGTVAGSWHTASTSANLDPGATESATPRATNGS